MDDEATAVQAAFRLAIQAGSISTLATQLRRIAAVRWPGYEIAWDSEVQEDFIRKQSQHGITPIFSMSDISAVIGHFRSPPALVQDRRALLWCLGKCLH